MAHEANEYQDGTECQEAGGTVTDRTRTKSKDKVENNALPGLEWVTPICCGCGWASCFIPIDGGLAKTSTGSPAGGAPRSAAKQPVEE